MKKYARLANGRIVPEEIITANDEVVAIGYPVYGANRNKHAYDPPVVDISDTIDSGYAKGLIKFANQ